MGDVHAYHAESSVHFINAAASERSSDRLLVLQI